MGPEDVFGCAALGVPWASLGDVKDIAGCMSRSLGRGLCRNEKRVCRHPTSLLTHLKLVMHTSEMVLFLPSYCLLLAPQLSPEC